MGNTFVARVHNQPKPVHPHACGEHLQDQTYADPTSGSSPRLWGTPRKAKRDHSWSRFIPTPVGNTSSWRYTRAGPAVHPHACGEHSACYRINLTHSGSSPRLWGTHPRFHLYFVESRFIPTPVGNTEVGKICLSRKTVHPHACGEHLHVEIVLCHQGGSSPRLWGTQLLEFAEAVICRFIPTPVGNTGSYPGGSIGPGSSPRLWGTHRVPQGYRGELRFIPTPVGNTNGLAYFIHHEPVHPHACGEHSFRLIVNTLKAGSSPRLWGTPLGNDAGNVQLRFIPTPVGNTPE